MPTTPAGEEERWLADPEDDSPERRETEEEERGRLLETEAGESSPGDVCAGGATFVGGVAVEVEPTPEASVVAPTVPPWTLRFFSSSSRCFR